MRKVVHTPPCEGVRERTGYSEPLDDAKPAAEAHPGIDVVFTVPLDALELSVFWSDWLRVVGGLYIGFRDRHHNLNSSRKKDRNLNSG